VYAVGVGVALAFLGAPLQPILAAVLIVAVVTVLALAASPTTSPPAS